MIILTNKRETINTLYTLIFIDLNLLLMLAIGLLTRTELTPEAFNANIKMAYLLIAVFFVAGLFIELLKHSLNKQSNPKET